MKSVAKSKATTAEYIDKLKQLLSYILVRQVDLEVPLDPEEPDEVRYVCDDVSVNQDCPDWKSAMQQSADIVAKLDIERTSKLRVPEAEPYQLTDAEWAFVFDYFEPSTPKSAAARKRFQRLARKLGKFLLYFAVFAYPPRVARRMSRNS